GHEGGNRCSELTIRSVDRHEREERGAERPAAQAGGDSTGERFGRRRGQREAQYVVDERICQPYVAAGTSRGQSDDDERSEVDERRVAHLVGASWFAACRRPSAGGVRRIRPLNQGAQR